MYSKKECVAMLLAGGQGSRLYTLTEKTAKPAVSFGGKYKIIDFPLSNCVNSGIDTVGVLTQYQPLVLNEYIGNGAPWDLDRFMGGVTVLPPYQKMTGSDWYKGTANAIYQNLDFIDRYDPEYVLILSGDHIYKMDYSEMIEFHEKMNADCTIAVLSVPIEEASRFGIMNTYEDGKIYQFEEKPKVPKSNKASMGIYLFNYQKLRKYLIADENDPASSNDFGKNVIPAMLNAGENMYAFPFTTYWKDVGTITSLWEANMDLLGKNPKFDIHDRSWRILSRTSSRPGQFVGDDAKISNCLITEGCELHGDVRNSVLSGGVYVAKDAAVSESVIFEDAVIEEGAIVEYAIIDAGVTVKKNARIFGKEGQITVIGNKLTVPEGATIPEGLMVNEQKLQEICKKSV